MSKVIEATQKCDPAYPETWLQFCRDLHALGKLYHFEDDPGDMIHLGSGTRTFTDEEVWELRKFMEWVFAEIEDPMEAAFKVGFFDGDWDWDLEVAQK